MTDVGNLDLPTLHVVGDNLPQAWYRAIKAVWENGLAMRTQYDRRDDGDKFIDPPSRDARVLIEVLNPFADPRYPPISHCERGPYLAELMGLKDHLVVPMEVLKTVAEGKELEAMEWPYTYHQRLFEHPESDGNTINQIAMAIDMVAKTPYTRRAMCSTPVPNIDPFLTEDIPCLRELQLRCVEQPDGSLNLCASTMWRSRDLYKAWGDNVLAVTFLLQWVAQQIADKSGREVHVGSYADYSMSCHIYGQDFGHVGGDDEKGLKSFFDAFPDDEAFVSRSMPSEVARDVEVVPQLQTLLTPAKIEEWKFPTESVELVEAMIDGFQEGSIMA